jgi:hypothetical protein
MTHKTAGNLDDMIVNSDLMKNDCKKAAKALDEMGMNSFLGLAACSFNYCSAHHCRPTWAGLRLSIHANDILFLFREPMHFKFKRRFGV